MEKLKANSTGSTICLTSSKKSGGEGRIKNRQAQGSVSGFWSHPSTVSVSTDSPGATEASGAGDSGPLSAPPTHPSTTVTHTHTHSCTLSWLTSHDTNDQPNHGYTHTTQSYSHAKRLHSQTSNLTVLSTKSHEFVFTVEEFQCTHTQDHCTPIISTAHKTLTGSPHDRVCTVCRVRA